MIDRQYLKSLSEMPDHMVAKEDLDVRGWQVIDVDGRSLGTVQDLLVDTRHMKVAYFSASTSRGEQTLIAPRVADLDSRQRRVQVKAGAQDSAAAAQNREASATASGAGEQRLSRAEEEMRIGTRKVDAGEVVVGTRVATEHVRQDIPVERERVRVERRPVSNAPLSDTSVSNTPVSNAPVSAVTTTSNEIRIPVVEEELVVEKRAVVKEELVISKELITEHQTVEADVRSERFDVTGDARRIRNETHAEGHPAVTDSQTKRQHD